MLNLKYETLNAERRTRNAERRTRNELRVTQNPERRTVIFPTKAKLRGIPSNILSLHHISE